MAMEELIRKQTSRKAYRSHVSRILNKVEDMLGKDIDEFALEYLRTAVTRLEKKREQITDLDTRISELIDSPDELETTILDSEELQDMILEEINTLKKRVEILSKEMLTKPPVVSDASDSESDDNVADESSHQEESGDNGITTPVSDLENVSNVNSVTLSTSISDTLTVCASPVVDYNYITYNSITCFSHLITNSFT